MSPCMNSRSSNAAVTSGNTFYVFQAVFLPLPPNEDMVSHPVNAWKTWRVAQTLGYIPVHEVAAAMDPKVCATLHVFHVFTPYLHLGEEARRLPGIHGKCFLKLLQHLKTYYSCKVTSEAPLHQLWNGL